METRPGATAGVLAAHFEMADLPDPDLVIRTSGEQRVSNFLLWQSAYSEFVFPETQWPDFTPADLVACVEEYRRRQRRFGAVPE
jgi:undecaprenyl diphosphate synthase